MHRKRFVKRNTSSRADSKLFGVVETRGTTGVEPSAFSYV